MATQRDLIKTKVSEISELSAAVLELCYFKSSRNFGLAPWMTTSKQHILKALEIYLGSCEHRSRGGVPKVQEEST